MVSLTIWVTAIMVVSSIMTMVSDAQSWAPYVALSPARTGSSAVSFGPFVVVVGGVGTDGLPNLDIEAIYASDNNNNPKWQRIGRLPMGITGSSVAVALPTALVGISYSAATLTGTSKASSDIRMFNISDSQWIDVPNTAVARKGAVFSAAHFENGTQYLIVTGGKDADNNPCLTTELFRLNEDGSFNEGETWRKLPQKTSIDDTCCEGSPAVFGNSMYMFNCMDCNSAQRASAIFELNLENGQWSSHRDSALFQPPTKGVATLQQYAVRVIPESDTNPTISLFDSTFKKTILLPKIGGVFPERDYFALVGALDDIYVIGGQNPQTSKPSTSVNVLKLIVPPQLFSSNTTYYGDDTYVFRVTSGVKSTYLRLSYSDDCAVPVLPAIVANESTISVEMPNVTRPVLLTMCSSYGVCSARPGHTQKPCPSAASDPLSCLNNLCCWDPSKRKCVSYDYLFPGESESHLFWIAMKAIDVLPKPPATPEPTPEPTPDPTPETTPEPTPEPTPAPQSSSSTAATSSSPSSALGPESSSSSQAPSTGSPRRSSGSTHNNKNDDDDTDDDASSKKLPNSTLFAIIAACACGVFLAGIAVFTFCRKRRSSPMARSKLESSNYGSETLFTATLSDFAVAQNTTSKYRILSKIGRGAHGTVFLVELTNASPKSDGGRFALKYIPCEDDSELRFALKEFDVIRRMKGHPNMVQFCDMFMNWGDMDNSTGRLGGSGHGEGLIQQRSSGYGSANGDAFLNQVESPRYVCLVMEYFEMGDLRKYIQGRTERGEKFPEFLIFQLTARISSLLAFLHSHRPQIVHRDIKPENVLLSRDSRGLIVTDFGLAHNTEKTHMSTRAGTLHYVAPEAWKGRYTSSVDMWALGCILYEIATMRTGHTGRVMFSDATDDGFVDEIREDLEGYHPGLVEIIVSLLRIDATQRLTAAETLKKITEIAPQQKNLQSTAMQW